MPRVVFLHPDLGIGGAERLIVDAAVALKEYGHDVHLLTAHHDKSHCFPETIDGTLKVYCVGDWLPRSCFGKFYAAFAYLRMIYLALYLTLFSYLKSDVVICDLISACIPVLKLFSSAKVLFYCHFPDQLLTQRHSTLKSLYRAPIDWLEEWSTGIADIVLVNSYFTGDIFRSTFQNLKHVEPIVLYPSHRSAEGDIDTPFNIYGLELDKDKVTCLFLSINRYERKKNVGLAIEALGLLKEKLPSSDWEHVHLVVTGGYDVRVAENIQYYNELVSLARTYSVLDHISFLRSCSDSEKRSLLHRCTSLIYTPHDEHFGIVPIEAMFASRPVIAISSGGPKETVLDEQTGFLCQQSKESFAEAMLKFVLDSSLSETMGAKGHQHVIDNFSFEAFSKKLHQIVLNMLQ